MVALVEGSKLIRKPSKLRRLAWSIKQHRDYLTFRGEKPRYLFDSPNGLPARYFRDVVWMRRYVVTPTIRARLRWPTHKLTGDALPESLRADHTLF
jgi:hypothetical protein